jgi:hypothetical protein
MPRARRHIELLVEPYSRWRYDGQQWIAPFLWACGEPGIVPSPTDPRDSRDSASALAIVIAKNEQRDCPDCRHTEQQRLSPPDGHYPTRTHSRFFAARGPNAWEATGRILSYYEEVIGPRAMTIDEAIDTTDDLIGMLKERLSQLYEDQRRIKRLAAQKLYRRTGVGNMEDYDE